MSETMSIHRGLAELKLINKKISSMMTRMNLVAIHQPKKPINEMYTKEDFEKNAKSNYTSVKDHIDRYTKIKKAIMNANSITEIEFNGSKMTITDVLAYKDIIVFKRELSVRLTDQLSQKLRHLENHNIKIEDRAIELAKASLSKDNVKITDKDAENIIKPYLENNRYVLVDPIKAQDIINDLNNEIMEWETKIDVLLSEANAMTTITID